MSQAWQMVTCSECGQYYRCTPFHDYYNATTTSDGVCETCLFLAAGLHPDKAVTFVVSPPETPGGG